MPAKRSKSKRISCCQMVKRSGLYRNLRQVAAGYKKAGLTGMAVVVEGVMADAKSGMTFSDLMEFQDTAHVVCASAIYTLADLGFAEWIKRRESRLVEMEKAAARTDDRYDAAEREEWAAHAAEIRKRMKFPDGPPPKAKAARAVRKK